MFSTVYDSSEISENTKQNTHSHLYQHLPHEEGEFLGFNSSRQLLKKI